MNARRVIGVLIAGFMVWSIGSAWAQSDAVSPRANVAASPPPTTLDPAVVQAKLNEMQQKAALINQLADKFMGDAAALYGAGFNAVEWKRDFGMRMIHQPVEALSAALTAPNLSMMQNELFNAPGKVVEKHATNLSWVTNFLASPCRIVDTRFGGGGPLGPVYRLWEASDTAANIALQGGNAAGCGTFPVADGFLLYVTVVPTGPGGPDFLTVQHNNSPTPPTSSTMNFYSQNIANFAVVACQGCSGFVPGGFYAYASRSTNVVIDLLAWEGTIAAAALDCVNSGVTAVTVAAGTEGSATPPACPAGYTSVAAQCNTNTTAKLVSLGWTPANVCFFFNEDGVSHNIDASQRCCRVPAL